jgi:hypothetical protein
MKAQSIKALLVTAFALSSPFAQAADDLPGHQAGSQYTATWHQHTASWLFTPAEGIPLMVSSDTRCAANGKLPTGVWLLTRDSEGQPELTALSTVELPAGHSGQVRLVDCPVAGESAAGPAADGVASVAAPRLLLDLLTASTGAVRIDD